jgi:hypothetical protein
MSFRRGAAALTILLAAALGSRTCRAEGEGGDGDGDGAPAWTWGDAARLGAGALTGLAAHEAGHVVANLALGNVPAVEGFLALGFIPFFAVRPYITCGETACTKRDGSTFGAGRRGKFAIVAAGFNVQHLGDEILLWSWPELRYGSGPYRKGLLAFNTITSVVYAVGSWAGLEDPRGDIANAAQISGISHRVLALFVLAPALLDGVRYFYPGARWAPFAAATSKATFIGLNFAF